METFSIDEELEHADWLKTTWDLPDYKSPEFMAQFPDLDLFRKLPVYKHAVAAGLILDDEWVADHVAEHKPQPVASPAARKTVEAVTFGNDAWRAVVRGVVQRPTFNARGPAMIFAQQVAIGLRPADPVE